MLQQKKTEEIKFENSNGKKVMGKTGDAFAFSQKNLSGQSLYISSNFL